MRLSVQQLSHAYRVPPAQSLPALAEVSFSARSGEFLALVGPSGCGKSTLLRILAGLLPPSRGQALLDNAPPQQAQADRRIGWLAQAPALLPWRTAAQNIALAQQINPQPGRSNRAAADWLHLVGLSEFANAYPATLSGGMQHRLALARTLALGADLWLMDEPFAGLDDLSREELGAQVLALWAQFHPTVLWVTHNIYEAVRLAERVLVFSRRPGRLAAEIVVQLPQPRRPEHPEFIALTQQVRLALESTSQSQPQP